MRKSRLHMATTSLWSKGASSKFQNDFDKILEDNLHHVVQNTFPNYTAWLTSVPLQHVGRLKIYVGEGGCLDETLVGVGTVLLCWVSSASRYAISGSSFNAPDSLI